MIGECHIQCKFIWSNTMEHRNIFFQFFWKSRVRLSYHKQLIYSFFSRNALTKNDINFCIVDGGYRLISGALLSKSSMLEVISYPKNQGFWGKRSFELGIGPESYTMKQFLNRCLHVTNDIQNFSNKWNINVKSLPATRYKNGIEKE
eukprot:TRINITY_DN1157_c0_g1_i2.p1 TRINITY_DN1157_c0_g1~~TRINITY_DN1157_c0_g1_i2.p1  ORF type:complete len:147 (-),score=10.37 TRINITY_DN1157_c0_g1_i2:92-532(-)